jgi:hypothetical protein
MSPSEAVANVNFIPGEWRRDCSFHSAITCATTARRWTIFFMRRICGYRNRRLRSCLISICTAFTVIRRFLGAGCRYYSASEEKFIRATILRRRRANCAVRWRCRTCQELGRSRYLCGFFEEQEREPLLGVSEVLDRGQRKEAELFLQARRVELTADFHQDFGVLMPVK